jgi:alpha-ketoglutarate-dependent taurine dioxygenase
MCWEVDVVQVLAESPMVTADPGEARLLVERWGAAILSGWGTTAHDAVAAAHAIFGRDVLQAPSPSEVRFGGDRDRRLPTIDNTTPLPAHTDGFAYGDRYPDYFLLSCAHSSPLGGESFLVDGEAVVDLLAARRGGRDLVERLQTVPVDQTEPDMQRSVSPIIGRTTTGRLMLRRFPFQRPSEDSTEPERDATMIDAWKDAITAAAERAPRFKLQAGDVAVIDNYRMMHGREGYADLARQMWRVWVWTTSAWGVPDGRLHSDSRYAVAEP